MAAAIVAKPETRSRIIPAVLITSCFAVCARLLRGVSIRGAAAGFLVTTVLFIAAGPAMFGTVLLVFVLTLGATRFGRRKKLSLAIAEKSYGRDAAQVLANVGVAATAAALAQLAPWRMALVAGSIAALAEAVCDTVSSETGKALSGTARMITTWRRVPAGSDGAVSLAGTLLGVLAAALVTLEAVGTRLLNPRAATIAGIAGILGMIVDSLLGATLERRGLLTNNTVNLAATAFSATLAAAAIWQFA